ncbi:MAG: hypothetical protein JWM68_5000 [Verrucomicrobiales bacterium]|nr:hypothetical protein [Verrucomicrobiales bacterium]
MRQDLRDFIDSHAQSRGNFQQFALMLPTDDAELDALIAEPLQTYDKSAMAFTILGALGTNRKVDARHIEGIILMTAEVNFLENIFFKLHGDVPKYLLAVMRRAEFGHTFEVYALFLMALWNFEGRGEIERKEIIGRARILMRTIEATRDGSGLVLSLPYLLKDDVLREICEERFGVTPEEKTKELIQARLKICNQTSFEVAVEEPQHKVATGRTMHRAVARVGRNEPCPCGSGKKYKHCCIEADNLRLQKSSSVPGRTHRESLQDAERFLTPTRVEHTSLIELIVYDPTKIPKDTLKPYFIRLAVFRLFEKAADSLEKLGFSPELEDSWDAVILLANRSGRYDIVHRLVQMRKDPDVVEKDIWFGFRLANADKDPAKFIEILDGHTTLAVTENTINGLHGITSALLNSKLKALGILLARGVIPLDPLKEAKALYQEVVRARDLLALPPDDIDSDIMDERLRQESAKDPDSLREAQEKLGNKAKEVRELKESLHQLQREIEIREKREKPADAPANVIPLMDERALAELRDKVETLKSDLKDRHNERNELRRELEKTQTDLEELRQKAEVPDHADHDKASEDKEADLLMPEETLGQQPVRLIEFPKKFEERLASLPRHVARNTMKTLGELASGEPSAFVGVVRLKACPATMRQRIGSDFRLLFRLFADRVQVVDLINRRDLDRRIKTLV